MKRRLLMAAPSYYGVEYEINPWMSRSRPADQARAGRQWNDLRHLLVEVLGAEVALVEPAPGSPDMVFTANAGLVRGRTAVISRFRHPERQAEAAHFAAWFREAGYEVVELPGDCRFEGEGDALSVGDTLFCGYRWRSEVRAHTWVAERLGVRALCLELTDPHFYHLDTCFCPLDAQTALYYPHAFDDYARRVLEAEISNLLPVPAADADRFGCNAVVLDKNVALNDGCPAIEKLLRDRGFTPHPTPLDEFIKAGGSAKCLTLHLN